MSRTACTVAAIRKIVPFSPPTGPVRWPTPSVQFEAEVHSAMMLPSATRSASKSVPPGRPEDRRTQADLRFRRRARSGQRRERSALAATSPIARVLPALTRPGSPVVSAPNCQQDSPSTTVANSDGLPHRPNFLLHSAPAPTKFILIPAAPMYPTWRPTIVPSPNGLSRLLDTELVIRQARLR
jgi:hypothetical protein